MIMLRKGEKVIWTYKRNEELPRNYHHHCNSHFTLKAGKESFISKSLYISRQTRLNNALLKLSLSFSFSQKIHRTFSRQPNTPRWANPPLSLPQSPPRRPPPLPSPPPPSSLFRHSPKTPNFLFFSRFCFKPLGSETFLWKFSFFRWN